MRGLATSTKEHIIDVAARLIHVNGFNKTSLDDILKASGVGKGNFYYHFESKEALGYAILDRYIQRFSEHVIANAFRPDRDPIERIFTLLDLFFEAQRARNCMGGCPVGNLAAEMSDIHEGFRQKVGEAFGGWQERIEETLAEAKAKRKLVSDANVKRLSQFLVAGIEGATLLGKVTRDPKVLEGCFEELKAHVKGYLT